MRNYPIPGYPAKGASVDILAQSNARDTSADGVLASPFGGKSTIDSAQWHRKVIEDMDRWIANNPGISVTQGRNKR